MKLAFSTLGCASRSFEEIVTCAEKFSVGGIEIRGIDGKMNVSKLLCFYPKMQRAQGNCLKKNR